MLTQTDQATFSRPVVAALRLAESVIATGILCVFATVVTQGVSSNNFPRISGIASTALEVADTKYP